MKKLNVILHETTIINFPFFWKLMVRYKLFSIAIPLIVISYSTYFYKSQNDIHVQKVYFKNRATDSEGPTSAISSVLGEKSNVLTESEIVGIIKSLDFQKAYTKAIYEHPEFLDLNLAGLSSKVAFQMEDYIKTCNGNESCILPRLRGRLFGFMSIKPDPVVTNKFFLQINTLDPKTTRVLLEVASVKIMENRVDTIKHHIEEQIKLSRELADSKRAEIESVNLLKLKEEQVKLKSDIAELTQKIASYDQYYQKLKLDLAMVETQVDETKKVSNKDVETDKILSVQKRKRLEEQIKKYERDIGAIRSVADTLSTQDQEIVDQLENELSKAKSDLKNMGDKGRKVSSVQSFIQKKEGESNFTEFNYRVLKEQYKKSKSDLDKMIKDREVKVDKLTEVTNKIEEYKPSFEYLKLLEEKNIQLSLLNSTVVSDLVFENELSAPGSFKKTSRSKVILFSLTTSFFILSVFIFSFYLLDDRIYDQQELEKSFDDLTIIGNTPDFD